jgi:hypothetical protein
MPGKRSVRKAAKIRAQKAGFKEKTAADSKKTAVKTVIKNEEISSKCS